jgi:glyoxylase-like metal-dependent hydrolase (beta-lactamase superfamily II)
MKIDRLVVGPLKTNCYVLSEGTDCIVIDAGGSEEIIIDFLDREKLIPSFVLATHGHFDHILSVSAIVSRYKTPFIVSEKEEKIMESFRQYTKTYVGFDPGPAPIPDRYFRREDSFKLGVGSLSVVETPGHTPGSCSFVLNDSLFTGDFVFNGSIGRTDFGGSYTEMSKSIEWAKELQRDYDIFPGHGDFTTLENEKRNNPFFNKVF